MSLYINFISVPKKAYKFYASVIQTILTETWCIVDIRIEQGIRLVRMQRWIILDTKSRRLEKEQFGIIGIQVAGCRLSLNVLIRDELEIYRYYKLHEAEIPIRYSNDPSILYMLY
ncbi:hypothetical protein Glove_299g12 [Diversispora epigaea]|uniref:Uncharacterized protein n=1 Tax=Diversispora epigaea TaxID=1348612 RepID=A0A397HX15_9GLOM|nr:hypothetical protein Glove_299g12 [Diversispora epigaea]